MKCHAIHSITLFTQYNEMIMYLKFKYNWTIQNDPIQNIIETDTKLFRKYPNFQFEVKTFISRKRSKKFNSICFYLHTVPINHHTSMTVSSEIRFELFFQFFFM